MFHVGSAKEDTIAILERYGLVEENSVSWPHSQFLHLNLMCYSIWLFCIALLLFSFGLSCFLMKICIESIWRKHMHNTNFYQNQNTLKIVQNQKNLRRNAIMIHKSYRRISSYYFNYRKYLIIFEFKWFFYLFRVDNFWGI